MDKKKWSPSDRRKITLDKHQSSDNPARKAMPNRERHPILHERKGHKKNGGGK